ncbi:hypothetical protein LCGC14_0705640 [marine sediment metagenome]|uniref:Bacteriophage Mu GpT domain-containing protein n=1 Tax=marine sediment metagenome TaxID=412755 RepID=A0A0F9TP50_9ZZZZ|nr:hypothetical protein [bacterium]
MPNKNSEVLRPAIGLNGLWNSKQTEIGGGMKSNTVRIQMGKLHSLAANAGKRREYEVRFITAGRVRAAGNRESNIIVPAEAIQKAISEEKFTGLASFIDHAGWFDYPSLRDMVGVSLYNEWNEETKSADGVIRFFGTASAIALSMILDGMLEDKRNGEPVPDVGLSIVFWPKWKPRDNREDPLVLDEFKHIESCDFVFEPAADGRVKKALNSVLVELGVKSNSETGNRNQISEGGTEMPEIKQEDGREIHDSVEPTHMDAAQSDWMGALSGSVANVLIANTDLPAASKERLQETDYATPETVLAAIELERKFLAQLQQDHVINMPGGAPRSPEISMGMTGIDQVKAAIEALIAGVRPADGIQPLTGIRELYHLLSGDFEMTGVFQRERIRFANVTSSTMAELTANALNKVVINEFQKYPRWWEAITSVVDFQNLQTVRWITLGGVGELPTVAEGAAYTELTWDDKKETSSFVKKGGYLGLTLEAIDKDDTNRLRAAPRALAQAGWLTLSKSISAIFTASSGVGPTLQDGDALFHSNHSNLLTTALSWTAYVAARLAMRKQTEVHSSERLGALTSPKFLLVPSDLEITALQILASEGEPGTADNDVNPLATGDAFNARMNAAKDRVIVVDLWTDTDDWALVADPQLYPSIGLGFRYGRTPEIFSVASPTAGLMFTNDTMPVKVRFFFATGPTDYRGLHKNNV